MKAVQQMLSGGCQEHRHHRQEEHTAEKRVDDREEFSSGGRLRHVLDRAHPGQDHGGVQRRIEPGQSHQRAVAGGARAERKQDQTGDNGGVSHQPAKEPAPHRALGCVLHTRSIAAITVVARRALVV
jgi:hypothetical protein